MNRALDIKNWNEEGNNYVLKGNPKNKWVGFQETVLLHLRNRFQDNFNIVIWIDIHNEDDYYCIPYTVVKNLFTEEHKTTGKYPNRWTAIILGDEFLMHSNSQLAVNISAFYAKSLLPEVSVAVEDDYFIENAKAEIAIRIGQSKFRKGVLKNFKGRCALSGIFETSLLNASHIIPWAKRKDFRGDVANGICLYIEYDKFFDAGLISFTDNLETIITTNIENYSVELQKKLIQLKGTRLTSPAIKQINLLYLRYHRMWIFKK